jgi:hypothetical protein
MGFLMFKLKMMPFAMMALAEDRPTRNRLGAKFSYSVGAAKTIYGGALIALHDGYAVPGYVHVGLKAVGIAAHAVDNSLGADGAETIEVEEGIFQFENYASDLIDITDIGNACFIYDDQTVAKTSGGAARSIAGIVRDVDSDGVWVEVRNTMSMTVGLTAANNLSDVALAATARANLGANLVTLHKEVVNLVSATASVYRINVPVAGVITAIRSVLEGHALATGNATITAAINGTGITTGVITITQSGSAVGDLDSCAPSALRTVAAGDVITLTVGGTNTDAAATAGVDIRIET